MIDRLLKRREVSLITTKSNATIYRGIANGTFPKPVKIGANSVAWPESVIQKWMDDCIEASAEVSA